jgi:hypothetical protein
MESVDHICSCLNGLTEAQKKQADAVAGGNFEKLLAEFQILRTTSSDKNRTESSNNPFENSRASDIRDIFFLQQGKTEDASFSLENFFSSTKSENQFENSRASNIRDIFFLTQEKLKESDPNPEIFDNSVPLDLEKLRRDRASPRDVPGFLEKRFQIFGPTVISRFL